MKKSLLVYVFVLAASAQLVGQVEPGAGNWKTWFITSGKAHRLPAPSSHKDEVAQVVAAQSALTAQDIQKIQYWNVGSPGYRWHMMMAKLWMTDISGNGAVAGMIISTATYDATVAAWDTKYAHNRPRPFEADNKIGLYVQNPGSPSYPCEHSVAAGVAVAIISKFYPAMADSVNRMSQQMMSSRIAAGVAFPSDTRAGFELGKQIAELHIEHTKDFMTKKQWDGQVPQTAGLWNGKNPMVPLAGLSKTVVLDSASQFRPSPPPDFAKEMDELRNFKQTFRSRANAFYFASQNSGDDLLHKKILEYNLHLNPPRAARIYASVAVGYYDAFTACFDAKYAYWGIRPEQYDPNFKPLFPSPPFPGYPSGHAVMAGLIAELGPYFFPLERAAYLKYAKDGAESRFHAGIHFRSDNEVGLELGKKIGAKVIERLSADGADVQMNVANVKAGKTKTQKPR